MNATATTETRALSAIAIGDRARKDMGDLASLAESMTRNGLLHPVVILADGRLVCGERRIKAAEMLGWKEVPVTVVSVEDLLSAERDENQVRKDFTPSEAVAVGRLIEERHRAEVAKHKSEHAAIGGKKSAAKRGVSTTFVKDAAVPPVFGRANVAAGRAVGMSDATYFRAKAVVTAAEQDPAHSDIVEEMDRTGNVSGAHRELERRGGVKAKPGKPKPRHKIHGHSRLRRAELMIPKAVIAFEGLCDGIGAIPDGPIESKELTGWADRLDASIKIFRAFAKGVRNGKV